MLPPQVHDLADRRLGRAVRAAVRPRGPDAHPAGAELAVAVGSPFRGRPGHVVALGRAGHGPAVVHDEARELPAGARGQGWVSVGHQDLLAMEPVPRQLHSAPGGLRLPSYEASREGGRRYGPPLADRTFAGSPNAASRASKCPTSDPSAWESRVSVGPAGTGWGILVESRSSPGNVAIVNMNGS